MARIRTIKPEFFTSEDIMWLSPLARLLYIGMWCEADREGRFAWKPKTLKIRYLPGDDCDIDALVREIVASGLVVLYGDGLAYIPTFGKHQHVNPRESKSTFPDPSDCNSNDHLPRVIDASARVQAPSLTHREEGRKEGSIKAPAAPSDFRADLFSRWKALPDGGGGAFLSKLLKDHKPEQRVLEAVEKALDDTRANPKAFVLGLLRAEQRRESATDEFMARAI